MKLIYLADIRLPTEKAHGIQIMKMCEAFAIQGIEVELMVPRRKNPIAEDPFCYYGVKKIFKINKISSLDFSFLNSERFKFFLNYLFFLFSARVLLSFRKYDVLYGRDAFYGIFF